MLQGFGA